MAKPTLTRVPPAPLRGGPQQPPAVEAMSEIDSQLSYLSNTIDELGRAYLALRERLDNSILHRVPEGDKTECATPCESSSRLGAAIESNRARLGGLLSLIASDIQRLAV